MNRKQISWTTFPLLACDPSFATPCKGKNNICDSSNICACLNSEYKPEAQGNDCYGKYVS